MSSGSSFGEARILQSAEERTWPKLFSVCCLVNDWEQYAVHRQALRAHGFDDQFCEFLVCDNAGSNKFSAFEAVRRFVQEASGKYVIIAHPDTAPLEPLPKLIGLLDELTKKHPNWGIVGNAGVKGTICEAATGRRVWVPALAVEMPDFGSVMEHKFVMVECIDENVMIIKNGTGITASADMGGFHFYALDVCLVAQRLGYESYVVDYRWYHESHGTIDAQFFDSSEKFQTKLKKCYARKESLTTCTSVYWGPSLAKEIASTLKAVRILDADPSRRSASRKILMQRASARWKLFPLLYWIVKPRGHYVRNFADFVHWRILWKIKIAVRPFWRDLIWWRQNWKSRVRSPFGWR